MNLAAIEAATKAWIVSITGVAAAFVIFQDEPRPMHNGVLVLLNATTIVGLGVDDITQEYDDTAGAETVTFTASGNRQISLSVQCETHDQRSAGTARQTLETARTKAQLPTAAAILKAANMSLIATSNVTNAPYKVDGHWVSRYVMDVQLGAISEVSDAPTETIETVEGTGHIAGQDLPFEVPA